MNRICVDYRDLNKASTKDDFLLPNIHILINNYAKHELQSFVDYFAVYHQILMHEEDVEKTAFTTPWGVYCYRVMPFSIKNAGATYMRDITTRFHEMIHKEIEVYVKDVVIKSQKSSEHWDDLKKFFERLRRKGIERDTSKIKAIQELSPPKRKKDVMSFLGMLNYISRFIAQPTVICEPIFKLLNKDVGTKWTEECQKAFNKIKEYLSNPRVLVPPEPGKPLNKPMPTGKLAKLKILLNEFYIMYITQKAIKGQALVDHLAENPVDKDYESLTTYFPDEELLFAGEDIEESYPGWRMFFDGAANFKGVGIGTVLISQSGQHYPASAKIRFPCANNMAEYEACIQSIRLAVDMNIKELLVIWDSDLLIHQVQGEWTTKNVKILPYLHCVKKLCKKFTKIEFKHIPRIQNELVDALATLSSMIQHPDKNYIDPIEIEIRDQQVYYFYVDGETNGKAWYYDIKRLLELREYQENATNGQKRVHRRLANHVFLNGEVLFRRSLDLGLLRCVDATEATRLLEEIHAGTCGPHMNGFTLAKKILRAGYFWKTMKSDSICYAQKCYPCQIHGDFILVLPNELNVMGSPWPFAAWGMDMIGPIEPVVSKGHCYILVVIDYITKLVEASTYKPIIKKVVAEFIRNNIVCRFGIPESIITDNTANLNGDLIREICEKFKIAHRNSTAYRPQINGAVEASNKNIKRILQKIVDNHRQWHEKLSFALLGYRTTMRTSTGETPYMLVYGTDVVIHVHVEIPSLRIIQEAKLDDA
uniref:Integrase catalytic domain-containing protein n=2 Tax=Nicotiana tabacum TaxID=4097 RepID=A0A1S4AFN8_TOBAC|nr:PREDICTED: uncharacterized protein LOC107797099 [Nicotiana tabacum]